MINTIKKLIFSFQSQKTKQRHNDTCNMPEGNYILITFPKDHKEPYIRLNITDLSDEECNKYSEALFNLNSGRYHFSFLELLKEMSLQDNTINKFIQSAIMHWGYLIKANSQQIPQQEVDNNQSDSPIVSPMEFNKHAK